MNFHVLCDASAGIRHGDVLHERIANGDFGGSLDDDFQQRFFHFENTGGRSREAHVGGRGQISALTGDHRDVNRSLFSRSQFGDRPFQMIRGLSRLRIGLSQPHGDWEERFDDDFAGRDPASILHDEIAQTGLADVDLAPLDPVDRD